MKSMLVYWADGRWYGSEVNWKRSGSGTYRETAPLDVPQDRASIERFAADNQYAIEWRGPFPDADRPSATPTTPFGESSKAG